MSEYDWRFRAPAPSLRETFDEMDPARRRRRHRFGLRIAAVFLLVTCSAAVWQTAGSATPGETARHVRMALLVHASSAIETLSGLLGRNC